jgi:hypothetical protein
VPDRSSEGEEPVVQLMDWVGRSPGRGRFVDNPAEASMASGVILESTGTRPGARPRS